MAEAANVIDMPSREVAVLWSIKGYHFFGIKPREDISMLVLPEDGNKYDENAMKVMMPGNVPEEMLNIVTRKADVHRKEQRIRDTLGKQVGRVPANLCRVFRDLLRRGMTEGQIMCYYGGK